MKTKAEIAAMTDDERIQMQHRQAIFRNSRYAKKGPSPVRSHLAFKMHEREKTKNEILDELEDL